MTTREKVVLLQQATIRLGLHPRDVFRRAYEYFEIRKTKSELDELYQDCCLNPVVEGTTRTIRIPDEVLRFCEAVLG